MRRPPLRALMLLPTLVTFAIGFSAFAFYIDGVEQANRLADIDDELVRAGRVTTGGGAVPAPAPTDDLPSTEGADIVDGVDDVDPPVQLRLTPDGELVSSGGSANPFSAAALRELSTRSGTFTFDEPRFRVHVSEEPDGTVTVTALSLDLLDESIADFRRTLLGGGAVILVLVAAVVWLLTARSVRPVTRMATTAARIADGELETRVDPPTGSRETAELAEALDLMLARLRSTIDDREDAARSAAEARDAMQRFLADMSHELRTPLTALKGYSDLYAGGMLDDPGALDRAMSRIGDESERLNGLVTDMLQLAREAPSAESIVRFDAADVVAVVAEDLRVAHRPLDVQVDVSPDAHTHIVGSPTRFHQAVLNVGSNACRHATVNTPVHFVVRSTDTDVVVEVVDHGPGVDPADVDKIFLPFYRPEASRGRDGRGGAGLGLAIAGQIVERHRGTIAVRPTPGGGATFVITIPLATPLPDPG